MVTERAQLADSNNEPVWRVCLKELKILPRQQSICPFLCACGQLVGNVTNIDEMKMHLVSEISLCIVHNLSLTKKDLQQQLLGR